MRPTGAEKKHFSNEKTKQKQKQIPQTNKLTGRITRKNKKKENA